MPPVKVTNREILFDHPNAKIIIDTVQPEETNRDYFYLSSPVDAVATVGVNEQGEIALTRQYRHPLGRVILDLPAGTLNPNEIPLDGARREFEEETGFLPKVIKPLGLYSQFPGIIRAKTHLFFAYELLATQQNLDDGENLEVIFTPLDQVLKLIVDDQLIDGSLQLGVLLAIQKGYLATDLKVDKS